MASEELTSLVVKWKNGSKCEDSKLVDDILAARNIVVDELNASVIEKYNELGDMLHIDYKDERMLCDDIAYMQLFYSAWTCELIRNGHNIRIVSEQTLIHPLRTAVTKLGNNLFKGLVKEMLIITIDTL